MGWTQGEWVQEGTRNIWVSWGFFLDLALKNFKKVHLLDRSSTTRAIILVT